MSRIDRGVVLALALASWGATARADEATRSRLLAAEHVPVVAAHARGKPDVTPRVDFERLSISLHLDPQGPPPGATFLLEFRVTEPLGGAFSILAIDWRPLRIMNVATVRDLDYQDAPEASEVLVTLDQSVQVGDRVTVRIDAALDIPCENPARCNFEDPQRHLVQFGWYPANYDAGLDDRMAIDLTFEGPGATTVCATGEPPRGPGAPPARQATLPGPSTLPAFAAGDLDVDGPYPALDGRLSVFACTPAEDLGAAGRMVDVAAASAAHHEGLFGPMPYSRLALAQTANGSDTALSPMELILLPRFVWTPNGADADALRDALLGHELAHQWFFNAVGVTAPEDAWLSEGTAEYAACRFQEARTGTDAAFRLNYWGYVLGVSAETDAPLASADAPASRDAFPLLYQKGSQVWRRLERRVGTVAFDACLRAIVAAERGAIATTDEVLDIVNAQLGEEAAATLAADLASVGVSDLEVRVTPGHGRNDPSRLKLGLRPRRGSAEPTPIQLISNEGVLETLIVAPDNDAAPIEVPPTVQWVRVDPERTTFRRVHPDPAADVNLSGVVDGMDLLDVWAADGLRIPGADWDDRLDVNGDERVDALDAREVAEAFGQGW